MQPGLDRYNAKIASGLSYKQAMEEIRAENELAKGSAGAIGSTSLPEGISTLTACRPKNT